MTEFGEEYLMVMEQEHKKEAKELSKKLQIALKDLTEIDHFDIKIEVKGIGLEIFVIASDPLDCITLSGMIISHLRRWDKEPTVLILP